MLPDRRLVGHLRACLTQMARGSLHDPEFALIEPLRNVEGLVLDVGANHGHAALSILSRTRRMRVHSVEPIPWLGPCLRLVRLRHPRRFRYRIAALDRSPGTSELFVPRAAGARSLSPRASLDPAEFEKEYLLAALTEAAGGSWHLERMQVPTVTGDSLALEPDLIKIDVEGSEDRVLAGLSQTLARHRPALLIEINNTQRWLPGLLASGYTPWWWHPHGYLAPYSEGCGAINVLLLHPRGGGVFNRWQWPLQPPVRSG